MYLYRVKQDNQILISPLMLEDIFHLSGNTSAATNVLLEEAHPGFHSVLH